MKVALTLVSMILVVALAGGACVPPGLGSGSDSGSEEVVEREVQGPDGTFALDLPDGWGVASDPRAPPGVLFAEGPREFEHLVVQTYDDAGGAEDDAVYRAVALAGANVMCRRHEDSSFADGPVIDCPDETRRPWVHKVLVPVREAGRSALLIVQVPADDFAEAADVAGPVARSFVWR